MTDLFQEPDDATPLEPEEREGLLQTWITHRKDINEAEEANILKAAAWTRATRQRKADLLNVHFVTNLHKRMFDEVWDWAGKFRRTERNIGIDANKIAAELPNRLDNARYWKEHETFPPNEIAVRLHHDLVAVHPFPNGNGRHARLMADLLIEQLGGPPFSWGGGSLKDVGELRQAYVAALREADNHNIDPLIAFARS